MHAIKAIKHKKLKSKYLYHFNLKTSKIENRSCVLFKQTVSFSVEKSTHEFEHHNHYDYEYSVLAM